MAQKLQSNPFLTDPGYLAALAAQQTGSQQLDSAQRAAQEQAFVQFGDPSLAQAAGFTVNPLTAAMAQANTLAGNSTIARLQQTRDTGQSAITRNLAARNMLDSGDLGYQTLQNQLAYGHGLYDAQQQAVSGLAEKSAQTAQGKQALAGDTTKALLSAYSTYVSNPAFWGAADTGGQKGAANQLATGNSLATQHGMYPVTQALARPSAPRPAVNRPTIGRNL